MTDCIFPGCWRVATTASWCRAHTPRSWKPTFHPSMQPAAVDAPNLFDLPETPAPSSLDYKLAGQTLALSKPTLELWKAKFKESVRTFARTRQPFTSEDVIAVVGLPCGDVAMNANNAVGAMMTALAKKGVIHKTGNRVQSRRKSSHGAELTEWIGSGR